LLTFFSIHGFRGVDRDDISIGEYQAIIGWNGSGKTHILEGIHLLSGGSLHYFQAPRSDDASFSWQYREAIGEKIYSLTRQDTRDIYAIQGTKVTAKKYRESLPYRSVFISPFDMNLLYFAPSVRRDYIDSILDRTFHQFRIVKREYEAIMRQRNALLKKIREWEAKREDLDFWDRSFAEKASIYGLYRKKWLIFIRENVDQILKFLEEYTLECIYESRYLHEEENEDFILSYLRENRERDILTGHTHIGPHLDDFAFHVIREGVSSSDASLFLSRGENKMLLLGLKQLEILFLKKYLSLPIILLLDDLFAELDMDHAERLIERFDADQIILTTQRVLPESEKWKHFSCINLSLR
jgi:DNA replication and repair protein RecF